MDRDIILTCEFGTSTTAPASYFLESWACHDVAEQAIREVALYGGVQTWEGPMGLISLRRA